MLSIQFVIRIPIFFFSFRIQNSRRIISFIFFIQKCPLFSCVFLNNSYYIFDGTTSNSIPSWLLYSWLFFSKKSTCSWPSFLNLKIVRKFSSHLCVDFMVELKSFLMIIITFLEIASTYFNLVIFKILLFGS